jgi:hypothetical protein
MAKKGRKGKEGKVNKKLIGALYVVVCLLLLPQTGNAYTFLGPREAGQGTGYLGEWEVSTASEGRVDKTFGPYEFRAAVEFDLATLSMPLWRLENAYLGVNFDRIDSDDPITQTWTLADINNGQWAESFGPPDESGGTAGQVGSELRAADASADAQWRLYGAAMTNPPQYCPDAMDSDGNCLGWEWKTTYVWGILSLAEEPLLWGDAINIPMYITNLSKHVAGDLEFQIVGKGQALGYEWTFEAAYNGSDETVDFVSWWDALTPPGEHAYTGSSAGHYGDAGFGSFTSLKLTKKCVDKNCSPYGVTVYGYSKNTAGIDGNVFNNGGEPWDASWGEFTATAILKNGALWPIKQNIGGFIQDAIMAGNQYVGFVVAQTNSSGGNGAVGFIRGAKLGISFVPDNGPVVSQVYPWHQEPSVWTAGQAQWLGNELYGDSNAITTERPGNIHIRGNFKLGNTFEVKIGDPISPYPELDYDTDSNYYSVENPLAGYPLLITGTSLFQIDARLRHKLGYPLYGTSLLPPWGAPLGTMWLNKYLGIWVNDITLTKASNAKPIKMISPLPDSD